MFRYNEFKGDTINFGQCIDAHGMEWSGYSHGSRSFEIYNNTVNRPSSHWTGIYIRGGDGVIFNNSVNNSSHAILLSHRTEPHPPVDKYPGKDQTRVLYAWGNLRGGNPAGVDVRGGHEYLFKEGRDFWDDYGTETNFKSGLSSQIPTGCAAGDLYCALDNLML